MGQYRSFLGDSCETALAGPAGEILVKPRDHSRATMVHDVQEALSTGFMSKGQASNTRGRSNWVATNTFGKIGRLGSSVMKSIQYQTRPDAQLTPDQQGQLAFHLQVIQRVQGRRIFLLGVRKAPWWLIRMLSTPRTTSPG